MTKEISMKITNNAKKFITKNMQKDNALILALNDGSNKYSRLGSCTSAINLQLVLVDQADQEFPVKIKNNLDLNFYTSDSELTYFSSNAVIDEKNGFIILKDDSGIIDGAMMINDYRHHQNNIMLTQL